MDKKRKLRVVPFAEFRSASVTEQEQPLPENAHPLLADLYRSMSSLTQEMQRYSDANTEYTRLLAEKDDQLSQLQQENEDFSSLLAQREEELSEAYEMIEQLETLCEESAAKYRRISAYMLKLELELRSLNRAMLQEKQPQRLSAFSEQATVDDLLANAHQEQRGYVLVQRDDVIYRVKKKG